MLANVAHVLVMALIAVGGGVFFAFQPIDRARQRKLCGLRYIGAGNVFHQALCVGYVPFINFQFWVVVVRRLTIFAVKLNSNLVVGLGQDFYKRGLINIPLLPIGSGWNFNSLCLYLLCHLFITRFKCDLCGGVRAWCWGLCDISIDGSNP